MKKLITCFFLTYLIILPVRAETDAKTIEFLKKLDLYYYCPGREGLKGFTCDLKVTTSQIYKDSLFKIGCDAKVLAALDGRIIRLTFNINGKRKLNIVLPKKSADPTFDDSLKEQMLNISKNLDPVLNTLDGDVFQPLYGPNDFKGNCSITSTADGFVLRDASPDGLLLETSFGSKARMTNVVGTKNGQTLMTFSCDYSWSPRGYMLNSYSTTLPSMNAIETDQFTYSQVRNYLLPVRIVKEMQMGNMFQPGSSITFDASNFQLKE